MCDSNHGFPGDGPSPMDGRRTKQLFAPSGFLVSHGTREPMYSFGSFWSGCQCDGSKWQVSYRSNVHVRERTGKDMSVSPVQSGNGGGVSGIISSPTNWTSLPHAWSRMFKIEQCSDSDPGTHSGALYTSMLLLKPVILSRLCMLWLLQIGQCSDANTTTSSLGSSALDLVPYSDARPRIAPTAWISSHPMPRFGLLPFETSSSVCLPTRGHAPRWQASDDDNKLCCFQSTRPKESKDRAAASGTADSFQGLFAKAYW